MTTVDYDIPNEIHIVMKLLQQKHKNEKGEDKNA